MNKQISIMEPTHLYIVHLRNFPIPLIAYYHFYYFFPLPQWLNIIHFGLFWHEDTFLIYINDSPSLSIYGFYDNVRVVTAPKKLLYLIRVYIPICKIPQSLFNRRMRFKA